jgi:RNA polymerase sigma factor (sigma-70 family)
MSVAFAAPRQAELSRVAERNDLLPPALARLVASGSHPAGEADWQDFVERYSRLLLRVAFAFAPGYDGAMDRYVFILEELRKEDYGRLRRFAADGRGRFSTWLVVVARRLCLDHYRRRYGRTRGSSPAGQTMGPARLARRRLNDLAGSEVTVDSMADQSQPDPLDTLDEADRGHALGRALDELEPADRLLLKLRFEQDLSAREIAALLGMPTPFHVYRRARTICALLRARLNRTSTTSRR